MEKIDWDAKKQELVTEDWKAIRTPFSCSYVDDLKRQVPADCRFWDKPDKVWLIHPDYIDLAEKLTKRHFYRDTQTGIGWTEAWNILHLRRNAPSFLIECAYHCLMQNESREDEKRKIEAARELLLTL